MTELREKDPESTLNYINPSLSLKQLYQLYILFNPTYYGAGRK